MITMRLIILFLFIPITSTFVMAKMPLRYLYNLYSEADIVARVDVQNEREVGKDLEEYDLKLLKPIKGVANEKTLKVVAVHYKVMPAELPNLSIGDTGMVFLQREKGTNILRVNYFFHVENIIGSTSIYLCKSGMVHCHFKNMSEMEDYFIKRAHEN